MRMLTEVVRGVVLRARSVTLLVSIAIFLYACTVQPIGVIYNRTVNPITVTLVDAKNAATNILIEPGASSEVTAWAFVEFSIVYEGLELSFEPVDPGDEFVVSSGSWAIRKKRIYLEFHDDGKIYVLKGPSEVGKWVHRKPPQPPGYPLEAVREVPR